MSKKTFGRLILPVCGFDFEEYDRNEENPPASECFWAKQCWNCRRVNKRNVVDAIVGRCSTGFWGYAVRRRQWRPKKMETLRIAGRCSTVSRAGEQSVGGARRPTRQRAYGYRGNVWSRYAMLHCRNAPWCRPTGSSPTLFDCARRVLFKIEDLLITPASDHSDSDRRQLCDRQSVRSPRQWYGGVVRSTHLEALPYVNRHVLQSICCRSL